MKAASLNQINIKLKGIPDNFTNEIIAYLDFLSFKANTNDWAATLTAKDFELIERGTADIKSGKVFSHTAAMKKINAHVKAKAK
jgi:hypothetical protein